MDAFADLLGDLAPSTASSSTNKNTKSSVNTTAMNTANTTDLFSSLNLNTTTNTINTGTTATGFNFMQSIPTTSTPSSTGFNFLSATGVSSNPSSSSSSSSSTSGGSSSSFDFLTGMGGSRSSAPTPTPTNPSSSQGLDMNLFATLSSSSTSANTASMFDFMSSTATASNTATVPSSLPFTFPSSTPTNNVFGGMNINDAMSGLGLAETSNADLKPLGSVDTFGSTSTSTLPKPSSSSTVYDSRTDFSKLTAGQIKKYLDQMNVDYRSCVEKAEFVTLATKTAQKYGTTGTVAPSVLPSSVPSSFSSNANDLSWKTQATAASVIEIGMPNAFEATGFAKLAPDVAKSVEHDRLYRAATTSVAGDISGFLFAAKRIPLAQLTIPMLPLPKLRVRLPAAVLNPVIREVTQSHMREAVTELTSLTTLDTTKPLSAADQKKLLPFMGQNLVGIRRFYEIPLRADVSNEEVIQGMVSAGRAVSLDAVYTSNRSVVLMQRVTVPSASYSHFTSTVSVTGSNNRSPVVIFPGKGEAHADAGTGIGSWLMRGTQTYVNCLCVLTGTNVQGEKVAMVITARFLVPDTVAPSTNTTAPSATGNASTAPIKLTPADLLARFGRIVTKDRVGALSSNSKASKSSAVDTFGLNDLASAGTGIQCALVNKRSVSKAPYKCKTVNETTEPMISSTTPASVSLLDDPFGLGGASTSSTSPTSTEDHVSSSSFGNLSPAEQDVLNVTPVPSKLKALATNGYGIDEPADTESNQADDTTDDLVDTEGDDGYDDGSDIVGGDGYSMGVQSLPDWSALRVSFLDTDLRNDKSSSSSATATNKSTATASSADSVLFLANPSSSSTVNTDTFTLSEVEDELVAVTCAFAASLRSEHILAESVWVDALQSAKSAVVCLRGESLPENTRAAVPLTRFIIHNDTETAITLGHRAAGEAKLFKAANPYEIRARMEETLSTNIQKLLSPTFTLAKLTPDFGVPVPHLNGLSLEMDKKMDQRNRSNSHSITTATVPLFPAAPSGLTATDETLRDVYVRAYRTTRLFGQSMYALSAVREWEIDHEMRARLLRKKKHVAIRLGAAFYSSVAILSQLHDDTQRRTVPTLPVEIKADPGRFLVTSVFNILDEPCLFYVSATAYKLLGEIAVTGRRILFHANVLGFRTKKEIPFDSIVAIHRSRTAFMVDNTLTITYTDDEKIATIASKQAKEKEKLKEADSKANPAPVVPSILTSSSNDLDMFLGLSSGSTASTIVPIPNVTTLPTATQPVSIDDAFGGLCDIDGATDTTPALPSLTESKATTATNSTTTAPSSSSSSSSSPSKPTPNVTNEVILPGLSEPLTPEDLFLFVQAGGSTEVLSQMHITPVGIDRDLLYVLFQTLRQIAVRPYIHKFDFPSIAPPPSIPGGGSLPQIEPLDYRTYLQSVNSNNDSSNSNTKVWTLETLANQSSKKGKHSTTNTGNGSSSSNSRNSSTTQKGSNTNNNASVLDDLFGGMVSVTASSTVSSSGSDTGSSSSSSTVEPSSSLTTTEESDVIPSVPAMETEAGASTNDDTANTNEDISGYDDLANLGEL